MTLLQIFQLLVAIGTIAIGVYALFWPGAIQSFTGLHFPGNRGKTEMRVIFGGLFIAIGAAPLFMGLVAYQVLGITYGTLAATRAISMLVDKSISQSNVISLISELIFAVILIL